MLGQGQVYLATGKARAAVRVGRRAVAVCQGRRCLPRSQFFLARALWRAQKSRKRALALARRARAAFSARGNQTMQAEIQAWLKVR